MLRLPSSASQLRALFDVAHLAEVAAPENVRRLPTIAQARAQARAMLNGGAVRSTVYFALAADGSLVLVRFTARGMRRLWTFAVWTDGGWNCDAVRVA